VFTARYALSPYIKQISFVFKGLSSSCADSNYSIRRWCSVWSRGGVDQAIFLGGSCPNTVKRAVLVFSLQVFGEFSLYRRRIMQSSV
jgi:hypothetical protein